MVDINKLKCLVKFGIKATKSFRDKALDTPLNFNFEKKGP